MPLQPDTYVSVKRYRDRFKIKAQDGRYSDDEIRIDLSSISRDAEQHCNARFFGDPRRPAPTDAERKSGETQGVRVVQSEWPNHETTRLYRYDGAVDPETRTPFIVTVDYISVSSVTLDGETLTEGDDYDLERLLPANNNFPYERIRFVGRGISSAPGDRAQIRVTGIEGWEDVPAQVQMWVMLKAGFLRGDRTVSMQRSAGSSGARVIANPMIQEQTDNLLDELTKDISPTLPASIVTT